MNTLENIFDMRIIKSILINFNQLINRWLHICHLTRYIRNLKLFFYFILSTTDFNRELCRWNLPGFLDYFFIYLYNVNFEHMFTFRKDFRISVSFLSSPAPSPSRRSRVRIISSSLFAISLKLICTSLCMLLYSFCWKNINNSSEVVLFSIR